MMPAPPDTVTCPYGHTFPSSQLTVRNGQYVCPVCDQGQWAVPKPARTWSRALLQPPLLLLAAAVALNAGLQIATIGLGSDYANLNLAGSGWLITNGALSLVGTAVILVGVLMMVRPLGNPAWTRRFLFLPLVVIGAGLVLSGIGGLFGIGLNLALLSPPSGAPGTPGASWQLAGQILDALSTLALGGVAIWIAALVKGTGETAAETAGTQTTAGTPSTSIPGAPSWSASETAGAAPVTGGGGAPAGAPSMPPAGATPGGPPPIETPTPPPQAN